MKALTLKHPWAFAVAYLGKDCENREWDDRLAELMGIRRELGQRIAIHGGAAPVRPKSGRHWSQLAPTNSWRQHCEDLRQIQFYLETHSGLPDAAARYLAQTYPGQSLTPELFILPGIVAVATVERITRTSGSRWAASGHLHIELSEVIALPRPVQTSGKQGLWVLDPDIEAAVNRQLTEWSRQQVPALPGGPVDLKAVLR